MEIVVSGLPRDIDFVKKICRSKVNRGVLRISPVSPGQQPLTPHDDVINDDEKGVIADDSKEPSETDDKYTGGEDIKDLAQTDTKKVRKSSKKE